MGSGINRIRHISESDRDILSDFLIKYRRLFWESVSNYAYGRSEFHLKHCVSLSKSQAIPLTPYFLRQFDETDLSCTHGVLDRVYGGNDWDSALCLWYSAYDNGGIAPSMNFHRDHTVYQRNAVMINVIGRGVLYLKTGNYATVSRRFAETEVIEFDNKMPHKVDILTQERAAILLFKIKPKYKIESVGRQLSLFEI